MNTLAQANIFFIITSIATVIVTALIVAILVYVLRIVRIVDKTTKELSEKIHSAEKSISRLNSQVISEKIMTFLTALFFSKKK